MLHLLTAASGTFATSADVRYTAAFGGNADISQRAERLIAKTRTPPEQEKGGVSGALLGDLPLN
jgi:hypothetical protein